MIEEFLRKKISSKFSGQDKIEFQNTIPSDSQIAENFHQLDKIGLYLHIPFCNQICPYCPYNKEVFQPELAKRYIQSVIREVEHYASLLDDKPVSSFYIGGGTPTTLLGKGIDKLLNTIYKHFDMQCAIHMESHPNHLTNENLDTIKSLGVKYLSIGIESLQERHLKLIERPYTVNEVTESIASAVSKGFECINVDYIFDLPGQTIAEAEQAIRQFVELGVHQAATYPLFRFPYTRFGKQYTMKQKAIPTMIRRRKFLKAIENTFYSSGYERSSVWAFTKTGTDKYCSVTVPSYFGLGASGSSYLKNTFYVNTFNISEYVQAIEEGNSTIALSVNLSEEAQMAAWLYWRIYETKLSKSDFKQRFHTEFDTKYGAYMNWLKRFGFLQNGADQIKLTDRGSYWIHAFEDFFSIDYINKLWGTSKTNPWPEKVVL